MKTVVVMITTDQRVDLGNLDQTIAEAHHARIEVMSGAIDFERQSTGAMLRLVEPPQQQRQLAKPKRPQGRPAKYPPQITEEMVSMLRHNKNKNLRRLIKRDPRTHIEVARGGKNQKFLRIDVRRSLAALGVSEPEIRSSPTVLGSLEYSVKASIRQQEKNNG